MTPLFFRLYEHFKKSFMRDFDNFYMISFKVCIIFSNALYCYAKSATPTD